MYSGEGVGGQRENWKAPCKSGGSHAFTAMFVSSNIINYTILFYLWIVEDPNRERPSPIRLHDEKYFKSNLIC